MLESFLKLINSVIADIANRKPKEITGINEINEYIGKFPNKEKSIDLITNAPNKEPNSSMAKEKPMMKTRNNRNNDFSLTPNICKLKSDFSRYSNKEIRHSDMAKTLSASMMSDPMNIILLIGEDEN